MNELQAKKRARYLIAMEMRQRIAEIPSHLEDEPDVVSRVWQGVVWDMADKVWPEFRKPPGGRSAADTSAFTPPESDSIQLAIDADNGGRP
jgi:hypothetical protein